MLTNATSINVRIGQTIIDFDQNQRKGTIIDPRDTRIGALPDWYNPAIYRTYSGAYIVIQWSGGFGLSTRQIPEKDDGLPTQLCIFELDPLTKDKKANIDSLVDKLKSIQ
jgi:hypothetical protein